MADIFEIVGKVSLDGIDKVEKSLKSVSSTAINTASDVDKLGKQSNKTESDFDKLCNTIKKQEKSLDDLKNKHKSLIITQGENSKEAQKCAKEIEDLSGELKKNKDKMSECEKATNKYDKQLNEVGDTADKTTSKLSKIGKIAGTVGKGLLIGAGVVATGAIGLVKQVSSSYGALQQSIGGIETLFGNSAQKVIENANNAYTTAGISANEYMQQVTSFSASLLQSLGGDTEKAADVADMAVRDMADNANKMGTSMEDIQNAYQGFAKQNYVMLDNLKLG